MSFPLELRSRTLFDAMLLRTRTPSHLISNAQLVSSGGSVPVIAFIGRSDSRSITPHSRAARAARRAAGIPTIQRFPQVEPHGACPRLTKSVEKLLQVG